MPRRDSSSGVLDLTRATHFSLGALIAVAIHSWSSLDGLAQSGRERPTASHSRPMIAASKVSHSLNPVEPGRLRKASCSPGSSLRKSRTLIARIRRANSTSPLDTSSRIAAAVVGASKRKSLVTAASMFRLGELRSSAKPSPVTSFNGTPRLQ